MERTKRIFISDLHLGGRVSNKELFDPEKHGEAFKIFIQWMQDRKDSVKDLVLLGDLFDTWACKVDESPATIKEIISHKENEIVISGIKKCLDWVSNVFYVKGNHDMEATDSEIMMLNNGNGKHVKSIPRYHAGLLYAEHGSRFAMFNAPDKMHDPLDGFPLGYYLTRMVSSSPYKYHSPSVLFGYIDDILEAAFTSQTLTESIVEAVREMAGLSLDEKIEMPRKRVPVSIRDITARYSGLYDRWVDKFGQRYAINAILGEMGNLGWFADRLCESNGFRVVVLGHTHGASCDKDFFFIKDRIYANAGFWCPESDDKKPTFVEVEKESNQITVCIWKIDGNNVRKWTDPVRIKT